METISQSDAHDELKVTFYPELYLQRRVWILNFLRREGITRVLDVGCGEGALLNTLCQPAPWLTPPPSSILPASPNSSLSRPGTPNSTTDALPSPAYSYKEDDIPNLHLREVHGLDISDEDLAFAMEAAAPPEKKVEEDGSEMGLRLRALVAGVQRWESLTSKVWKGGLQVINEEFKDIECIVGMEVIEHLPDNIFLAFAPVLLGVYHPKYLLVTTPSYTFNARFTSPHAPASARTGYQDPTGRTDRTFRHSDHKFEWTREEFQAWCQETAKEWGYEVYETSIGRALEVDPWQRDSDLQGATQVAAFYKADKMGDEEREERAGRKLQELNIEGEAHECLASYQHPASTSAETPRSLEEIAKVVKARMEEYRLSFMRMEELWFEPDIGAMCGGWIEMLVRAVEGSMDLNLKRDVDGVRKGRNMWNVELIGGVANPFQPWGSRDINDDIPEDWTPGEAPNGFSFEGFESSDMEGSTGAEGDVSATSDDEESDSEQVDWGGWTTSIVATEKVIDVEPTAEWGDEDSWGRKEDNWSCRVPPGAMSSGAGWDGDESEDTTS